MTGGILPATPAARIALPAIILLAVVLRIAAALLLRQPLASDGLAYFTMAQGLAERGVWMDNFGQHAFYSPGYPLLLAPFFALFGSSLFTALAVNLLLAALSTWLVAGLAARLTPRAGAPLLAALGFATWLPGIWNATLVAKENLSTALVLGLALCSLAIARGRRPAAAALCAGLLWGAGLLTGGSSLLLCAGTAVALLLLWRRWRLSRALGAGSAFLLGALIMLAPWLHATDRMIGRPVLTTNAAFNLYLGHNPAATGRFVSIAETPLGPGWEARRLRLGEAALADRLQAEAEAWISAHPGRSTGLALRTLLYFWEPNLPDADDFAASRAIALIRLVEVAQYCAFLLLGGWGLLSARLGRPERAILAAMILGFWLVHAAAYVIPRYRDPVMPLLIVSGAAAMAARWTARAPRRQALHAG